MKIRCSGIMPIDEDSIIGGASFACHGCIFDYRKMCIKPDKFGKCANMKFLARVKEL